VKRRGDPRDPGHLDDSVVRAAREDADGRDDTNAQLRAMRAVWLEMREEDPPDGGLVDLLAAARANAGTMRARPTLWQRVLAGLRRPPALAFATVVVIVGGAVLFIGRGKGMRAEHAAGSSGPGPPAWVEVEAVPGRRAGIQRAPARSRQAELEEMYRQCESAARRGDCATVRQMVGRIAKTDRSYRARIVKQAAVARCLADTAAEVSD
jgi:hypothetical protein